MFTLDKRENTGGREMYIGRFFKNWVLTAGLLVFVFFFPGSSSAIRVGETAPDFSIRTFDGKEVSYDRDLKGKRPVYLIFWATW